MFLPPVSALCESFARFALDSLARVGWVVDTNEAVRARR